MSLPASPMVARRRMAQAYASIGLETQVMSASPERLITLLLQGALAAIAKARLHLKQGDIAHRGMAISKAIEIVDSGLKASLDHEQGDAVAEHLLASYDLVLQHLLQANLRGDEAHLDTAHTMLNNILDAWRSAADAPAPPSGAQPD